MRQDKKVETKTGFSEQIYWYAKNIYSLYNLQLMLSTFLPFYLLPPVTKFRGVFGGRKLFLPGHFGLIFDGRVETCFYYEVSYGPLLGCVIGGVT